jgi:hypothetical protein
MSALRVHHHSTEGGFLMKSGLRDLVHPGITYGEFLEQEKADLGNRNWTKFAKRARDTDKACIEIPDEHKGNFAP